MNKPLISVVIAYRNDKYINFTLAGLGKLHDNIEVIIVDDASDEPYDCPYEMEDYRATVIRNESQRGVGYCFDRGVSEAKGNYVVFMGADVIVKNENWQSMVLAYCAMYPKGIGCSTCISGDPTHLDPNDPANDIKRYGATILPFATTEDLPSDSPLLDRASYYVGAWDAKWIKTRPTEEVSEVPCIYGAMYFTTKKWYIALGGWDNVIGSKLSGHARWGSLEPWLSLKNWLYGGQCHVVRDLETMHIFYKYPMGQSPHGRTDFYWYNKAFICHTMLGDGDAERLLKKIEKLRITYELPTLPYNLGIKLIKHNWAYVNFVKKWNELWMAHDFDWFCDKFNVKKDW